MRRETPINFPLSSLPSVASSPVPRSVKSRPLSLLSTPYFLPPLSLFSVSPSSEEPKPKATLRVGPHSCLCVWCRSLYNGLVRVSNLQCLKAFVFVPVCFSAYSSTIGSGVKACLKRLRIRPLHQELLQLECQPPCKAFGIQNTGKFVCVVFVIWKGILPI